MWDDVGTILDIKSQPVDRGKFCCILTKDIFLGPERIEYLGLRKEMYAAFWLHRQM